MRVMREDILERLTPFDVYGRDLARTSNGFKMLCPFHDESKPSFIIRQDMSFHCFGCGKYGTPFDYVMAKTGSDFMSAFKHLADLAGLDVEKFNGGSEGKFSRMAKINAAFLAYAQEGLTGNQRPMRYLVEDRTLSEESIRRFRLGYVDGRSLEFLRGKGFRDEDIEAAGLEVKRGSVLTPLFRKRLVIPIVYGGQVKGFGARAIGELEPKYLNSPTTLLFQKRRLLFGLDPSAIRQKGYAIVVEGYFDVIMHHQMGFRNTVAPLGTSLTAEQIAMLSKHTDHVVLIYDGDNAGKRAADSPSSCFSTV